MNPNELKKFITGMGAIAELSVLYYKACLKAGAESEEALLLTKIFLQVTITDARRKDGNDD